MKHPNSILFGILGDEMVTSVTGSVEGFIVICRPDAEALEQFFDRLFFGTVPEALAELTLTEETRLGQWMARVGV